MDASTFSLTGDADSIRSSARKWTAFSTAADTAAGDIRGIDSGDFQGDEADTFRDKMNADLPPHLDATATAWSSVASALTTYAATLAELQTKLTALQATAQHQQATVDAAGGAVADAKTADARHTTAQEAAKKDLEPGATMTPDTYQPQSTGAANRLSAANEALQATITAANTLRADHNRAVDTCVNDINDAAGTRFQEPPGFWGRLKNSFTGWVSEHADVLKSISGVLKTISGIAGILAMIPVLAPVMGPIALVAGGGALLIDATVKIVTGQGSWGDVLFDAATMLPLGKGVALLRSTKAGASVARAAGAAGQALRETKVVNSAKYAVAAVRNRTAYEGGRLLAGAKNAMSRVEVELPVATRSLATSAGTMSMKAKANVPAIFTSRGVQQFKNGMNEKVYEITVNRAKYGETAEHTEQALQGQIWSGFKSRSGPARDGVKVIDRPGAAARRTAWNKARPDVPSRSDLDRDEFPPAVFREEDPAAAALTPSLKYISRSDNRGAGATMGNDLRRGWEDFAGAGLPNGARVRILVG